MLEEDVERFLKAGNQIQYIDDGVSAQDPQGRGKPLRGNRPKDEQEQQTAKAEQAPPATNEPAAKEPAAKEE